MKIVTKYLIVVECYNGQGEVVQQLDTLEQATRMARDAYGHRRHQVIRIDDPILPALSPLAGIQADHVAGISPKQRRRLKALRIWDASRA